MRCLPLGLASGSVVLVTLTPLAGAVLNPALPAIETAARSLFSLETKGVVSSTPFQVMIQPLDSADSDPTVEPMID